MSWLRVRLSTVLVGVAVVATLLAFWKLKPRNAFDMVPFEFLVLLLGIILATFAVMLRAFRQRPGD